VRREQALVGVVANGLDRQARQLREPADGEGSVAQLGSFPAQISPVTGDSSGPARLRFDGSCARGRAADNGRRGPARAEGQVVSLPRPLAFAGPEVTGSGIDGMWATSRGSVPDASASRIAAL